MAAFDWVFRTSQILARSTFSYLLDRSCSIFSGAEKFLPMGWDSSHATLKVTSRLKIYGVKSLFHQQEKHRMTLGKVVMQRKMSKMKEMKNGK